MWLVMEILGGRHGIQVLFYPFQPPGGLKITWIPSVHMGMHAMTIHTKPYDAVFTINSTIMKPLAS